MTLYGVKKILTQIKLFKIKYNACNLHYIIAMILKQKNRECVHPSTLGWGSHGPYSRLRQPRRRKEDNKKLTLTCKI